jgi:hypothetical protein
MKITKIIRKFKPERERGGNTGWTKKGWKQEEEKVLDLEEVRKG